jgi:hypothetical protein
VLYESGDVERALGLIDAALLDRENPDHETWFVKFEEQLANCDSAR